MDSVMKGLMGAMPPHNFWARTAPELQLRRGKFRMSRYSNRKEDSSSPKVAEPLDQLGCVILVELDVWKVIFENSRARITHVEEHQLGFAQMHWSQCTGVNCRS